jgi:hypothetical protein
MASTIRGGLEAVFANWVPCSRIRRGARSRIA